MRKIIKIFKSLFLIEKDNTFVYSRGTLELDTKKFFRSNKFKKVLEDFDNSGIREQIKRNQ